MTPKTSLRTVKLLHLANMHMKKHEWYNLESLSVIVIFFLIFGKDYGEIIINNYSIICAVIILFLVFFSFLNLKKLYKSKLDNYAFNSSIISICLLTISAPFWYSFYNAYIYIGVIFAYLVYILDFNRFRSLLIYTLVFCTFIELIEYATQHYFYIVSEGDLELNEKFFSGGSSFRAKGIFKGPLSVGPFSVMTYLLNKNNRWVLLLAFISCFLANSRTGLVILSMLFVIQFFSGKIKAIYLFFTMIVGLVAITILLSNPYITASVDRIIDVSNVESNNNQARIFFWVAGLKTYITYPLSGLLVGSNGYFHALYNNNPESGWICLLTDCGIIGFFFYLLPLLYCLSKFEGNQNKALFYTAIVFFIMNTVITANLSATSNILYWLLMFEFYNKAKYGVSKCDLKY